MMGAILLGAMLALPASAQAQEQQIGTVVGVPMTEYDAFVRVNALPGVDELEQPLPANRVTLLHQEPEFNSAIATVAVTRQDTGQPAGLVYFPTFGNRDASGDYLRSSLYDQINADDAVRSQPQVFGSGYDAVLGIEIGQNDPGTYEPGKTRFMMVPSDSTSDILAVNPSVKMTLVHRQRAYIGGGDLDVQLLAIHPDDQLGTAAPSVGIPTLIPGGDLLTLIQALNPNLDVQSTDVSGQFPMTLIEVQ
jgi:hypothetical protein